MDILHSIPFRYIGNVQAHTYPSLLEDAKVKTQGTRCDCDQERDGHDKNHDRSKGQGPSVMAPAFQ